jgi:hypothetical protein
LKKNTLLHGESTPWHLGLTGSSIENIFRREICYQDNSCYAIQTETRKMLNNIKVRFYRWEGKTVVPSAR